MMKETREYMRLLIKDRQEKLKELQTEITVYQSLIRKEKQKLSEEKKSHEYLLTYRITYNRLKGEIGRTKRSLKRYQREYTKLFNPAPPKVPTARRGVKSLIFNPNRDSWAKGRDGRDIIENFKQICSFNRIHLKGEAIKQIEMSEAGLPIDRGRLLREIESWPEGSKILMCWGFAVKNNNTIYIDIRLIARV